jgi:hypothetical protein
MNLDSINHFAELSKVAYLDGKEAKNAYKELGYNSHVLRWCSMPYHKKNKGKYYHTLF